MESQFVKNWKSEIIQAYIRTYTVAAIFLSTFPSGFKLLGIFSHIRILSVSSWFSNDMSPPPSVQVEQTEVTTEHRTNSLMMPKRYERKRDGRTDGWTLFSADPKLFDSVVYWARLASRLASQPASQPATKEGTFKFKPQIHPCKRYELYMQVIHASLSRSL